MGQFDLGMLPGAAGLVGGAIQSIIGGGKAGRAQRQLEKMVNNYQSSGSIMDYYTKALNKYNMNPYNSAMYQLQSENARSGTAQGINALQDRRSSLGGVSSLIANQNNNLLKAAATAEGQQAQALGQLGQATAMKDREDKYKFEAKYNLLSAKAGGANQVLNTGLTNAYNNLSSLSDYAMANKLYGDGGYGGGTGSRTSGGRTGYGGGGVQDPR
jgi:hypothetical protein